MTTEMTPEEFAGWMGEFEGNLTRAVREALAWGQGEAMRLAVEYSSGPYSSAELRQMGAPFAVDRHPSPLLDPSVINVQSGEFRGDWQAVGVHDEGPDLVSGIRNDSRVAEWLRRGTRTMYERPIEARVLAEIQAPVMARLESSVTALLGG